jgi:hypothetical protein
MKKLHRIDATIRRGSRVLDIVLLTFAIIALLLILTGHAHGAPMDWLNPGKVAAKLERAENTALMVGGCLAGIAGTVVTMFLLKKVFGFIAAHWKLITALAAIVAALAAVLS